MLLDAFQNKSHRTTCFRTPTSQSDEDMMSLDGRSVISVNSNRGTVVDGMSKVAERRRSKQALYGVPATRESSSFSSLRIARERARSKKKKRRSGGEGRTV